MSTRPQLSGPIHAEPVDELAELREEVSDLRERLDTLERSYQEDRDRIGGLFYNLRAAFVGNGDMSASPPQSSGSPTPHNQDAWRAWKQQLPGPCAKVIDALLIQPLTQSQLITYCKMHYTTVSKTLSILKRNGLVEHDGKLLKLKRL